MMETNWKVEQRIERREEREEVKTRETKRFLNF